MSDNSATLPSWDVRWPDPVAIQVAAARLMAAQAENSALNRALGIHLHMEEGSFEDPYSTGILVTPWAVERIFWINPPRREPSLQSAMPLTIDDKGRVAPGQGVILQESSRRIGVLTAWEPETGHYFVETLLPSTLPFRSCQEALQAALGAPAPQPPRQSLSTQLETACSRRSLFGFLRS
ncbi:MAG: hypothetical protein HQL56_05990 [Magnetococcales bacterium]|nr:hypothetical protein [Magnetococcales bacterium]